MTLPDYSPGFYREHAQQYAQVAADFRQSVYLKSSHPKLQHDWDLWERLTQLAPGLRGLDAGCGAGARDVFHAWSKGYDITGIDAIPENIQTARDLHPEIADRVFVANLEHPLPFADKTFDLVACNRPRSLQRRHSAHSPEIGARRGSPGTGPHPAPRRHPSTDV